MKWLVARGVTAVPLAICLACAGARPMAVTPADIPELAAAALANPGDGSSALRLAAALLAADRCDSALVVARRGMELRPRDALGPLVAGDCLERRGDDKEAIALYESFTARFGNSVGAPAVAARAFLARRAVAQANARQAVLREADVNAAPADRNVLAVLPLEVVGDSAYQPLSVGLAQLLSSDLALLQRFRLVERMQLQALLDEISLGAGKAVDPATAARAGRLLRAGTLVHGVTLVPPDERIRLEVSLVGSNGEVVGRESVTGALREALQLEKDLVIGIAGALGYQLSAAERRAILENGTRSLAALLSFSRGILDQDAGNYPAAALHFGRAVRADPAFQQAREAYRATVAAGAAQAASGGTVGNLATTKASDPVSPTGEESAAGAVTTGVGDVAATQGERLSGGPATQQAAGTATSTPPPSTTGTATRTVAFGFRFVIRIP